ncbi:MAG TPA: hypothetical protein VMZ26_09190 [Pyrinomonadaceae bacterium]|nr:hypothetical protein [Pyrinomonadaceae bacterium]
MNDANIRAIGKILGVLQIIVAIFVFDTGQWNEMIVSALLFLGGVLTLTTDMNATFIQKCRSILSYVAILLAVVLVIMRLTVG